MFSRLFCNLTDWRRVLREDVVTDGPHHNCCYKQNNPRGGTHCLVLFVAFLGISRFIALCLPFRGEPQRLPVAASNLPLNSQVLQDRFVEVIIDALFETQSLFNR